MHEDNTQPALSIVIASWSGEAALTRCLEHLIAQAGAAEVIVAFRGASDVGAALGSSFAGVRFVRGPADADVFELRSVGVRHARGRLIGMLEDHAAVCDGWVQAILAGRMICGGPIENEPEGSAQDWALYFIEYGIYMPPMRAGEVPALSGVNMAYDGKTLRSCREVWEKAFYETDVNAAFLRAGHKLILLPDACVRSRLRMPFRGAMEHLFAGGVYFGDFRTAKYGRLGRMFWLLAAPAIPFVLLFRIIRITAARRPARLLQIVRALPWLVLLLVAWAAGEAASYARRAPAS
ncbi:hypothetical protein BH20VER3_BH20VER3_19520 [soil metagenome]